MPARLGRMGTFGVSTLRCASSGGTRVVRLRLEDGSFVNLFRTAGLSGWAAGFGERCSVPRREDFDSPLVRSVDEEEVDDSRTGCSPDRNPLSSSPG